MPATKSRKRSNSGLPTGPHGGVQLLLIQHVEHLGKQGDVVEVRGGYARNYLLPQGLATVATDHHKRMVEKHKAKLEEIHRQRVAGLRELAEKMGLESVTIEANANDEGHLYGSVGPQEIAKALKERDLNVTPDMVRLTGPLKELGLYTVKIHLGQDVDAEVKVWVVPSASEEEPAKSDG